MKSPASLAAALATLIVLAGCSSMPAADSPLMLARSEYSAAQSSAQVSQFAAGELRQAGESLDRANAASAKHEKDSVVDHLAYLTRQQVAIARETAAQKASEQSVAAASAERDRMRLAARTREADVALANASAAQRSAEASQRSADASQRSAAASQQRSEASQRQSEASQRQSEESQRQSRESQAGAEVARAQAQDAEARARQLETMLKELQAKKTDRGMVVTLGDVLFDTNEARLKPTGMRDLQRLANFFKEYPKRNVLIEGFTDSTGTSGGNRELAADRAASVRTALVGMGVGSERITSKGYGASYPVAGNDTVSGRQLNRRVEMVVSDDNGAIAPR